MKYRSNKLMDIRDMIRKDLKKFYSMQEIDAMITILFEEFSGVTKLQLAADPDLRVSESEMLRIFFAVKDLKKFRPIQYIIGVTEYCGLTLKVDERALIPRPETEELVRKVLKEEGEKVGLRVLDIGTGSGAIAIALALNLKESQVTAIDISPAALSLASENAGELGAKVVFKEADFLNPSVWQNLGSFDIIVSNPPYIPESERPSIPANVAGYEPHQALFTTDEEWLTFYEAILEFSNTHLNEGGAIYAEIHERAGDLLLKMARKNGYEHVMIHKDLSGKDRFLVCGRNMGFQPL